jgi:HEAT repeat protein
MRTSRKILVTVALLVIAAAGYGLYWGLFFVGGGQAADRLVERVRSFMQDRAPDHAAAEKLFSLEDEADRVQALHTMAGDDDARVRAFAATQMATYRTHAVVRAALERLSRDEDPAVREAARASLKEASP